ncbi:MAG: hypothetical protein H7A21_04680 [Spirochaetales bacterium]|nr:hypothetical protein [Leptospiraceae bacterium]MCP5480708.1 hypothetical protein [Spirochaetales bacterium]MCP5484060.1 hypothetical protein [Spirochaetales bacterium]
MKRLSVMLAFCAFLLSPALFAGEQEGLRDEFRAVLQAIHNRQVSEETMQARLEENLLRALTRSMRNRFYTELDDKLDGLNNESLLYERATVTTYYVKFKTYLVLYEFQRDPRLFVQGPISEKFLEITDDLDIQSPTPAANQGQ